MYNANNFPAFNLIEKETKNEQRDLINKKTIASLNPKSCGDLWVTEFFASLILHSKKEKETGNLLHKNVGKLSK